MALLRRRLVRLAEIYLEDFGVEVTALAGAGAGGGLAGGLAAAGATLVAGFDLVATELGLAALIAGADLVVTGEGNVDAQTYSGNAAGGVATLAARSGVPVLLVAGEVDRGAVPPLPAGTPIQVVDLVERFGRGRAEADVTGCVQEVVTAHLAGLR